MRIMPVQSSYNGNGNYQQRKIVNTNQSNLMSNQLTSDVFVLSNKVKNNSTINFGNINKTALSCVKEIPLEDKLASLFDVFKRGDVITIGKDFKDTQNALKESLDSLDHVIKRVFFIGDNKIKGNLVFYKNDMGETEVLNTNNFNMYIRSVTGKDSIKPNNSAYIVPDDILYVDDTVIKIKQYPPENLSFSRHKFAKVYDFTQVSKDIIKRQNTKELTSLVREVNVENHPLTFADVGGQKTAINELKKGVLFPIKFPAAFADEKVNHGIILTGPPGTGKTLLAEALANESNAHYVKLNGSELKTKWHGESEKNLRDFFADLVKNQPSIVVFDEFDSVAKKRDSIDPHNAEFVNQFLSIMTDLANRRDEVYVIATTNRIEMLDDAIIRSGRFGKYIEVGPPDLEGTRQILDIHTAKKNLDDSVDKDLLAREMHKIKATGADIARLVADARSNAFERAGIFEKMENGTFTKSDIENLKIIKEDFSKAISSFASSGKVKERKRIGYN